MIVCLDVSKCIWKLAKEHYIFLGHKHCWRIFFKRAKNLIVMSQIEIEFSKDSSKIRFLFENIEGITNKIHWTIFLKFWLNYNIFSSFFQVRKLFLKNTPIKVQGWSDEYMRKQVCQHRSYLLIREGFLAKKIYITCVWYLCFTLGLEWWIHFLKIYCKNNAPNFTVDFVFKSNTPHTFKQAWRRKN